MDAEAAGRAPTGVVAALLEDQRHLIRWQIAGERAAFGLKVLAGLAALLLAFGLGGMIWQAARADGVVIEAFSTPPDLDAHGLTGQVVASQLRDRLDLLNAEAETQRDGQRYVDAWSGDVSIQIPQTGVSIGELQRLLRGWLGREKHITGEFFRTKSEARLTVRVAGQPAVTATASADDLDGLLESAALQVFAKVSPYRYAVLVDQREGASAARPLFLTLTSTGSNEDRAWAWGSLIRSEPTIEAALADAYRGVELAPVTRNAWVDVAVLERRRGHQEAMLKAYREAVKINSTNGATLSAKAFMAEALGDFAGAAAHWAAWSQTPNAIAVPTSRGQAEHLRARDFAELHDIRRARALVLPNSLDGQLGSRAFLRSGSFLHPNTIIAFRMENWPEAVRQLESLEAAFTAESSLTPMSAGKQVFIYFRPMRAQALAHLGRFPDAEALLATTPLDCYLCIRSRGVVAALKGDAPTADRWFAEAVRQAPSLPQAQQEWGEAMLARAAAAKAVTSFRASAERGPRWAEPRKGEADAWMALNEPAKALPLYKAAADRAPRWGGLHLKWGEALAAQGKAEEAEAKWRAAAGMDLTAAERARLQALLQKRTT